MTATRNRVPAGTPTGGQFAASEREETAIALTAPTPSNLIDLPEWDTTGYPAPFGALDTRDGSFDACKVVSAEYTQHLIDHGYDADWVQVIGAQPEYPEAHPKWVTVNPAHWQHYVTRVRQPDGTVTYIDWTNRQFDPGSPWPLVQDAEEFESRWADSYDIPAAALADWNTRSGMDRYTRNTKRRAVAPRT